MKRRHIFVGGGAIVLAGSGLAYLGLRQMGTMEDYNVSVAATRAALSERPEIRDLIRYATLASNAHNTQPWRFGVRENRIEILPDLARRTPAVDPDDHHLFVSLGCAAQNLALAAGASGRPGELSFSPAKGESVAFTFGGGRAPERALFDAIPRRQSTRADYDGRQIAAADLDALAAAAETPGIDLVLITDRPQLDRVRDLVVTANSLQMADATFVRELKSWLRFSPRQALAASDGLFGPTTGNPPLPSWLGSLAFDLVFKPDSENDKYSRQLRSSAGVAVFVSQREDKDHWVRAGYACQRFALQATALGIKVAFVNQPVEIASLRPELAALVGMAGRRPDLVMRFGHAPALPFSARRSVGAVLA